MSVHVNSREKEIKENIAGEHHELNNGDGQRTSKDK